MAKHKFEGTITAIVTPFKKDLNIDFEKFKKLIEFQIENGVDGIVVCGSTGESATLSAKEKISLILTAIETVNGRVKVIAGTGTNNTAESIDMTTLAKEHGADGVLIVAPYYNKPTQEGLYNHYRAIADSNDIPVIIYNVPSRAVVNIHPEIQLKLAEDCPNIVATKEASGNLEQMSEIIRNAPEKFVLLSGDDALTLPIISIGGRGVVSVISNYTPKKFSEMVNYALKGKYNEARKIHYELFELMKLNFIEPNPIPVKAALSKIGLLDNYLRLPLMPITKKNSLIINKALEKVGLI
jgi:4-hydroxy-tetrahydrodipicolinate synthase